MFHRCRSNCWRTLAALLGLAVVRSHAQSEWIAPGPSLWSDPASWSDGVPNAPGAVAIFGPQSGFESLATIDLAPATVGQLQFLGPGAANINGTQPLTLATEGSELPQIFVEATVPPPFLAVDLQGFQGMEKLGAGELVLDGPVSYFGPTVIAEGALILGPGSFLQNGPVLVQTGAVWDVASHPGYGLAPTQVVAGGGVIIANELRVTNNNFIAPGEGLGVLSIEGSVTFDAQLPLGAGGIEYELSADPALGDGIDVSGNVTVLGNNQLFIVPVDNQLPAGLYPLLTYGGNLNAGTGSLQPVHSTRLILSVDTSLPGEVLLDVAGSVGALIWQGDINNDWDIGTTANWTGDDTVFFDLDNVQFDDSATRFQVNVVENVRPGSVLFENSANDYQISGPQSIQGTAPLTINGGGAVTFLNESQFGPVDVANGTLRIGSGGRVTADSAVQVGAAGQLQLDDGELVAKAGVSVAGGGRLTGDGFIRGDTVVGDGAANGPAALLSPGFSPGTIEIEGDLELQSDAETLIEISGQPGNPHDLVLVDGNASLDGVLRIGAIDGYVPQQDDEFTVVMSDDLGSSEFADVEAARVGEIILWPSYDSGNVMLIGELIGDMDLSGEVDEDDIPLFAFAMRDNDGYDDALLATEHEMADIDGNGRVDFGDINPFVESVQQNTAATYAELAAAVFAGLGVPEPSSGLLVMIAGSLCALRRTRGKRLSGRAVLSWSGQGPDPGQVLAGDVERMHLENESAACPAPQRTGGFTLVELLVVIAVISVLIGLLLPAIQASREAGRKTTCKNHARQLALALQAYEGQHVAFPEGARRHRQRNVVSVSWHALLLPHLEQQSLYQQIAPDANGGVALGGHNLSVHSIPVFHCPSAEPPYTDLARRNGSNYVGITGAGRGEYRIDLEDTSCGDLFADGVLIFESAVKPAEITDGLSHTLLLGERTYWLEEWTYGAKWRGDPPDRICVGASKNLVYPPNADLRRVGYYVRDLGVPAEQRAMVRNDLLFGSRHAGGTFFSFADASVHFLEDAIDFTVLSDLASRNGGETLGY